MHFVLALYILSPGHGNEGMDLYYIALLCSEVKEK